MASASKLEELNLSRDEVKRLGDALKDEKFRKMLLEYAEELQDPENRRRYEEEIAQMENERGMDVTFIRPEPGYVLKTSINGDTKAFINISKSDKIDKPSSERKLNEHGKNGLMWHIPHSFSPPREDFDKQKNKCKVYDYVVHPDTYRMAESNVKFKQMVEDTALDGIEKQFDVKVDRKNVKRPKITFKGTPTATVIRNRNAKGPQPVPDESGLLKDMPYPYQDKTTVELMKEREKSKVQPRKDNETLSGEIQKKDEGDATIPKYTIVHRSEIDMQEYRNAPDAKPSTRPRELVVKIELPLLKSAAQVNLDTFEKSLLLTSKKPAAYKLDLSLPYPVDVSQGNAKFDKQKRTLTVTLPVIPEKVPSMPTFVNGTGDASEEVPSEKPLIEVLPDNDTDGARGANQSENKAGGENMDNVSNGVNTKLLSPHISYILPEFTFTQDTETVSFVLKAKNITEHTINKTSSPVNELKLLCTSRGEGGFPLHYSLYLRFAANCSVVPEHCSVDVTNENVVLILLKDCQSRGLWDRFWAGSDADMLQECLFLTTNNLQQQLNELDEASVVAEQTAASTASGLGTADPALPLCNLEVTAMNEKKLTIKISPKDGKRQAEEEDDEYDPPSSAEIEVVHTRPSPSLHGILKQRTVSESSEDFLPDPESPRSPTEEDDELSSSLGSLGKRRSVSFSEHIDKATFKSSASVNSMKTSLKSKRKRHRKWEEKKEKANSRRRHNSGGSEGSGDDHTQSLSDSHSVSEEESLAESTEPSVSEVVLGKEEEVSSRKETVFDFRTKSLNDESNGKPNLSVVDSSLSGKEVSKRDLKAEESDTKASRKGSRVDNVDSIHKNQDGGNGNEDSIAAKIKSKLAESAPKDTPDDSDDDDDDDDGEGNEKNKSNPESGNTADATFNEHRTECAFDFSNGVIFDLDIDE